MTQRIFNAHRTDPSEIAGEERAPLDTAVPFPARLVLGGVPPAQDQGSTGTCVAHAAYGLYAWWYRRKYGKFPPITEPSILAFYDLCMKVDGVSDPLRQRGTTLLTALRVMAGSGYPLDTGGRGPHISGYHYVGATAEDGRRALAQFQTPVLFRVEWDANWISLPTSHILKAPVGQIIGGHAMYEFGYDLNVTTGCDIDRNSWNGWSSDGFPSCYFAEAYKDRPTAFYECWQVTGIN